MPTHYQHRVNSIIARAQWDYQQGHIYRAIARYEGAFRHLPAAEELHDRVAALYLEVGDKVRAGRHWYFKEELSEVELDCMQAFERSLGNSSSHILKKLLYKEGNRLKGLSGRGRLRLKSLMAGIREEQEVMPNFARGLDKPV